MMLLVKQAMASLALQLTGGPADVTAGRLFGHQAQLDCRSQILPVCHAQAFHRVSWCS